MTAPRIKVLLAEDEKPLAELLRAFLGDRGFQVVVTEDGQAALSALRAESFDVALLDIVMPELDGLEVLRRVREDASPPEVIIITGNGTIETAIAAMKLGAYDYLTKPYRMAEIEALVRRAWEKRQLARENVALHSRLARLDAATRPITQHAPLQAVLDLVGRVAPGDAPVLVLGESGTGKELVARAVHARSTRSQGPLVEIQCAAIPGAMLESELFGHERGAFASADTRKLGLLEMAAGGTVFMKEIGGLDPSGQGKVLRALETGSFFRVGGTQKVEVDVRIVASSNRDLERAVDEGTFRRDLFHRINTITVTLPPLRDRNGDVPLLASHFLAQFGGNRAPRLSAAALDELQRHHWPGNVRELRNVMERLALVMPGALVEVSDLPVPHAAQATHAYAPGTDGAATGTGDLTLQEVERQHVERTLRTSAWHQGRAAASLGISSKTLYRKIREYGLARPAQ